MIFTDRKITIRNGKSTINEPVVLYRGDYEVSIKFTIMESKFRFKSGVNLVDSEKASHGQLAILAPYGGNVFSDVVKCEDGTVTFTLTKEMIDQLEEVGLYSFQIRLFDYYRESRVSIPPVEFGIEVREPVASEDHDNTVNNAIVGYSIAKVVDGLNEDVPDTFDEDGQYNKTNWKTGDRISQGKLNKIEDAIDKINQNEKNDVATLDKRVTNNFNVLSNELDTKVGRSDKISVNMIDKNQGKIDQTYLSDSLLQQIAGDAAVNAVPADNSITMNKLTFTPVVGVPSYNLLDLSKANDNKYLEANGMDTPCTGSYVNKIYTTDFMKVNPGSTYNVAGKVYNTHGYGADKKWVKQLASTSKVITIPSNVEYIRCSLYIEDKPSAMVYEGPDIMEYRRPDLPMLNGDDIVDKSISEDKLSFKYITAVPSYNLLNIRTVVDDYFISESSGKIGQTENQWVGVLCATDFIKVNPGDEYTVIGRIYNNKVIAFDANFARVTNIPIQNETIVIPSNVEYIRCSLYMEDKPFAMIYEGVTKKDYVPYSGMLHGAHIEENTINETKLAFKTLKAAPSYNILTFDTNIARENYYIDAVDGIQRICTGGWQNKLYTTDFMKVNPGSNYTITGKVYNTHAYDADKNWIGQMSSTSTKITIPSNVEYIRCSLYIEDKPSAMVYEGHENRPYVTATEGVLPDSYIAGRHIQDKTIEEKHMSNELMDMLFTPSVVSTNLFNKNTVTPGYFVEGWTGHISLPQDGSTGHNASDWIPVEPGEQYYIDGCTSTSFAALYNMNKVWVRELPSTKPLTVPEGVYYMRITVSDAKLDTAKVNKGPVGLPYQNYGRLIGPEQLSFDVTSIVKQSMRYCLPETFEVVAGEVSEIFFDSILGVHNISDYYISLSGFNNINESNQRKMVITNPSANSSGIINVYDNFNTLALSIPLTIKVNPVTNPSTPKNILVIGDSLTGQDATTINELHRKITDYGLTNLNLIGTRNWGEGRNHEGRGGWKINDYLVDKEDNPFWSDILGRSSFKEYCDRNGYSGIDYCIIHMNWNDSIKNPTHMYTQYKKIMTLISEDYPNCKIAAVSLSSYSSKNVSQLTRWCESTKFTAFDLADAYSKLHDDNANWYYINMLSQVDVEYANKYTTSPVNIRSTETEKKLSDHVHFSKVGYLQIADAYFRKLMEFVNN